MTSVSAKRKASVLDGDTASEINTAGTSVTNPVATLVSPTTASRHDNLVSSQDNRRRSSRARSERKLLNIDCEAASYKDKSYNEQSAIVQMDVLEELGRDIWNESIANSR
eukprot:CAMPEP_0197278906 /NCGR_PEP_ID=MMETSP1432-20130617/19292_1 /TAXON_ID=44447 /ORGANISM="Pseudo-nitzschia delicatissima, Strain UNC1205" /LENGTH=109 /DNA_ID=CAMNT_0042745347 /DNA_START=71 /DNA_END=396 /DNA_ORIENTATION=+